jgi:integrase
MAWVEERSGRCLVRWRDGQGRKRQRLFRDKVQASLFAGGLPARRPARHSPASLTLGEYLLDTLTAADDLRESTRYHYLGMVRRHFVPVLGSLSLADVGPMELRAFFLHMREQGYSRSYRAVARNVLSRTFRLAAAEGIVGLNPLSAVPPPRDSTRREVRPLEVRQVEALADAILPRYRVPVLVMAYAGLRVGEVGALTMPNANLLRRELRVQAGVARAGGRLIVSATKTQAGRRSVPMPEFLARELARHVETFGLAPDGRIFHTPGTNQYSNDYRLLHASALHKPFKAARQRAGLLHVTPHTLRHTYAAFLIREGAHPKVIQTLMGHTSIKVTMDLYGHLFPGFGEELAARLDDLRVATLVTGDVAGMLN